MAPHMCLLEMPEAHLVQGDNGVLEERLHHYGEVFTLQVLVPVGQSGDTTLRKRREAAQPSWPAQTGPSLGLARMEANPP